ncbi:hypothetical protein B0T18DRAFT_387923 [Schizothecium vesticola]|uniref:Uncharacterized protein n=1 Tax=Schizothecium vesticola TaxID=314040 RepID=A0AA40KAF7_9PEZI|nr:hypothetical protein B0T18DRAFT_387923 [Schizothecium vesticola]
MIFFIPKALALLASLGYTASTTALPKPRRLSAFPSFHNQGYSPKTVSGCTIDNEPRFAAIWEKYSTRHDYVARHGLTDSAYQAAFNQYAIQGYRILTVSAYVVGNVDYYAAIWDTSAYQQAFIQYVDQGYRLSHVAEYTLNRNQDRYAAIFSHDCPGSVSFLSLVFAFL